ncbi:hypothetical protein VTK56DRAFT_7058 [Thermocarpiscus australiensis]
MVFLTPLVTTVAKVLTSCKGIHPIPPFPHNRACIWRNCHPDGGVSGMESLMKAYSKIQAATPSVSKSCGWWQDSESLGLSDLPRWEAAFSDLNPILSFPNLDNLLVHQQIPLLRLCCPYIPPTCRALSQGTRPGDTRCLSISRSQVTLFELEFSSIRRLQLNPSIPAGLPAQASDTAPSMIWSNLDRQLNTPLLYATYPQLSLHEWEAKILP